MAALDLDGVFARLAERWRAIDPLLPPAADAPHCGAPLMVGGPDETLAVGSCEHWSGAPGSLDLSWGAARRFHLSAAVGGPDVAAGLDELLYQWGEHLDGLKETGEADTAAVIDWPSRDVDGIATLLAHGLDPLEVLAVRDTSRWPTRGPARTVSGVRIRQGGPADADEIARLGLEIIRFDSRFGTVTERSFTLDALRREAAGLLSGPDPWTWLAERDGQAVGMLAAQRPEAARWLTPMVGAGPAAYLMLMFVEPGERGGGVGAALADQFHEAVDAAGVAVTLLHYEQLNPLSAPFWNRQGYRPLWTTWQATPARALR
jgi:GNAT superfamily N-acetyltransferase